MRALNLEVKSEDKISNLATIRNSSRRLLRHELSFLHTQALKPLEAVKTPRTSSVSSWI